MDSSAPLHPALPDPRGQQPAHCSVISDGEMKRLNIEVSYNLCRLVAYYRERGLYSPEGLYTLLSKAYRLLPMPQARVPMNRDTLRWLMSVLWHGQQIVAEAQQAADTHAMGTPSGWPRPVPVAEADRSLANMLTLCAWRSTEIERLHSGVAPAHPLGPHEQRFTVPTQRRLLREVAGHLGAVLFWFEPVFAAQAGTDTEPSWPATATALATTFFGMQAADWSLVDRSAPVTLRRQACGRGTAPGS